MFTNSEAASSGKAPLNEFNWTALDSVTQLAGIVENSMQSPQIIFKHSTSCGISSMVLKKFQQQHLQEQARGHFYKLDLLKNREVSNEVASFFKLRHESPQILVIHQGALVAHNAHYDILQTQLWA